MAHPGYSVIQEPHCSQVWLLTLKKCLRSPADPPTAISVYSLFMFGRTLCTNSSTPLCPLGRPLSLSTWPILYFLSSKGACPPKSLLFRFLSLMISGEESEHYASRNMWVLSSHLIETALYFSWKVYMKDHGLQNLRRGLCLRRLQCRGSRGLWVILWGGEGSTKLIHMQCITEFRPIFFSLVLILTNIFTLFRIYSYAHGACLDR